MYTYTNVQGQPLQRNITY